MMESTLNPQNDLDIELSNCTQCLLPLVSFITVSLQPSVGHCNLCHWRASSLFQNWIVLYVTCVILRQVPDNLINIQLIRWSINCSFTNSLLLLTKMKAVDTYCLLDISVFLLNIFTRTSGIGISKNSLTFDHCRLDSGQMRFIDIYVITKTQTNNYYVDYNYNYYGISVLCKCHM